MNVVEIQNQENEICFFKRTKSNENLFFNDFLEYESKDFLDEDKSSILFDFIVEEDFFFFVVSDKIDKINTD